jgi:hypothetical protein
MKLCADRRVFWLPRLLLLGVSVGLAGLVLGNLVLIDDWRNANDFSAFWSFAVVARLHGAASLYDYPTLHAMQVALGMRDDLMLPFPYPPTFIAMLWPLGFLPPAWAFVVWIAVTLGLYLVALGWKSPSVTIFAAILPTSSLNIFCGQNGFLSAALLLGGLRLARTYPVLSGVLLGLLTYKPQFGILVPVALAAARLWLCMYAAIFTTLLLVVGTGVFFSWSIWWNYLQSIPTWQVLHEGLPRAQIPTILANLQLIDVPSWLAWSTQVAAALIVVVLVWRTWRCRGSQEPALLVLVVGTFLATPYVMLYDLTALGGTILLFLNYRARERKPLNLLELAVLSAGIMLPFGLNSHMVLPISTIVLVALLSVALPSRANSRNANQVRELALDGSQFAMNSRLD